VPFIDVSAASLTFRPDAPSMPVLDHMERDAGPLRLSLRLLGASHQAVVATPDGLIAETLAYRSDLAPDLPEAFSQRVGSWRHRYACTVETLTVPELRQRVRALRDRALLRTTAPDLLVGVFGEDPDALTALEVTTGTVEPVGAGQPGAPDRSRSDRKLNRIPRPEDHR
jgi:hypothetical protein